MNNSTFCTALVMIFALAACSAADQRVAAEVRVDAGIDRSVSGGDRVALAGMARPSAAAELSFDWIQTAGPVVELSGPGYLISSFVAPSVGSETALVFRLQVTGRDGSRVGDSVVVLVGPENSPVAPGAILAASL